MKKNDAVQLIWSSKIQSLCSAGSELPWMLINQNFFENNSNKKKLKELINRRELSYPENVVIL